ncbi:uncharacterized protein [Cicer arietinum]|uniref:uncharacterized protein n=1 Tax=Cicer arietinum TaxID=3827 RepID=UPI003CC60672
MIVSHLSSTRYIEEAEEAIKTSFQALEIANDVFMGEGFRLKEPKLSTISLKSTKSMLEGGAFVKFKKLIEISEKKDKYGLGYLAIKADQENRWNNDVDQVAVVEEDHVDDDTLKLVYPLPSIPGKPLIMYLTVLDESMGYVLGYHDESDVVIRIRFGIRYTKAIKGSALAEYLAQQPVEDYQSMQCEFPDEGIMTLFQQNESPDKEKWTLVFDGASNALGHGIGVILISPENQFTPFTTRLFFDCTKNIVEYEACVMGITAAIESKVKVLEVYGDSLLVIHQTKGEWETRDSKLILYHTHIKELTEHFEKITFHHIPREGNQLGDALATLSSMFKISIDQDVSVIKIQQRDKHAYFLSIEEELDRKPWFYDIKSYVKNREYPSGISNNDKRVLRRGNSFLIGV